MQNMIIVFSFSVIFVEVISVYCVYINAYVQWFWNCVELGYSYRYECYIEHVVSSRLSWSSGVSGVLWLICWSGCVCHTFPISDFSTAALNFRLCDDYTLCRRSLACRREPVCVAINRLHASALHLCLISMLCLFWEIFVWWKILQCSTYAKILKGWGPGEEEKQPLPTSFPLPPPLPFHSLYSTLSLLSFLFSLLPHIPFL